MAADGVVVVAVAVAVYGGVLLSPLPSFPFPLSLSDTSSLHP